MKDKDMITDNTHTLGMCDKRKLRNYWPGVTTVRRKTVCVSASKLVKLLQVLYGFTGCEELHITVYGPDLPIFISTSKDSNMGFVIAPRVHKPQAPEGPKRD